MARRARWIKTYRTRRDETATMVERTTESGRTVWVTLWRTAGKEAGVTRVLP